MTPFTAAPHCDMEDGTGVSLSCTQTARRSCSGACGLFVVHMVSISASRAFFCSSFKVLHFENRVRCSSVNSAGPFPSEKNCDKVIPNALHTASKVGSVGALFLLNIFVTVEWERPDSYAKR